MAAVGGSLTSGAWETRELAQWVQCKSMRTMRTPVQDLEPKMLAVVVCACNSRAGEVETSGYLGLTGQPALANGQAPDSVSDPASKKKK